MVLRAPTLLAAAVALALAPAAGAHHATFSTGTYTARTSQKTMFKFKIVAHTAYNHCGSRADAHCFIALSDPNIAETCTDGTSYDAGLFDVPSGSVSSTGHFSYHQGIQGSNPLIDFHALASGSKVTGSFREMDPGSGPTGMLSCDSGTVTFTAKRG